MRNPRRGRPFVRKDQVARGLRSRVTERDVDPELRQLRSLQRAFSGPGRDLLIFGDSAMFWTTETDGDQRNLADMIVDSVGENVTYERLVGPGYNPRIIMTYLEILATLPSQPRAIVAPASMLMATAMFLEHPSFSYVLESEDLKRIVASGDLQEKRLKHADPEAFEEYDRRPAPSLVGAKRTAGEHRLMLNSRPTTRWQTAIRLRAMMDYYIGERLEADSPGVVLIREMGAALKELGIPAVTYIPPGNHEVGRTVLGPALVEHVEHNLELIVTAFHEGAGADARLVNALLDSPASEFVDPAHLGSQGRLRLAERIADELRPVL